MSNELTADQVAYLRERAEATRVRWAAHAAKSRLMTDDERLAMERATQELDAEVKSLVGGITPHKRS